MNSKHIVSIMIITLVLIWGCGNNTDHYEYTGMLEGRSVKVPVLTGGKIISFFTEEGERVQKGQILAVIDSLELSYQMQQLKATLREIDIQSDIAKTNLSKAENDLQYVRQKYTRIKQLFDKNSATKQNLDDVENNLKSIQSAYTAASQNLQTLAAKRQQIKARQNSLKKKLDDCRISAPFAGILTSKYFEVGEAVPPMSALLEIIAIDKLECKIYISEGMLVKIKHGQQVTVKVDGLDKELTGKVRWISPKAEFTPKSIMTPETRTSLVYAVEVVVENENDILKHGMPVVVVVTVNGEQ